MTPFQNVTWNEEAMSADSSTFECVLEKLGIRRVNSGVYAGRWIEHPGGSELVSINPANGEPLAHVNVASREDYELCVSCAQKAFDKWRTCPAPQRGEIIRQVGNALRTHKRDLGRLVTPRGG